MNEKRVSVSAVVMSSVRVLQLCTILYCFYNNDEFSVSPFVQEAACIWTTLRSGVTGKLISFLQLLGSLARP